MKITEAEVAEGITMYVFAGAIGAGSGTVIALPLDVADRASDKEIAGFVRRTVDLAHKTEAVFLADRLLNTFGGRPYDRELLMQFDDIEKIERQAGRDRKIDAAIELIATARARAATRSEIPRLRREIRGNYDQLFVSIGRRDGFRCAACGSSNGDLQVDHIVALIKGGDNDPGNLQLLCSTCNARKSGN